MSQDFIDITAASIVRVVACKSPLSNERTEFNLAPGDTVGDAWKYLNLPKGLEPLTFVNGEPTSDGERVLGAGDLVNVRGVPQGDGRIFDSGYIAPTIDPNSHYTTYPQLGQKLLDSFVGRTASYASQSNSIQSPIATPPPAVPYGQVYYPQVVGGFGGAKDTMLAPITSVGNQSNQWGRIPRIYGTVKVYPPIAGQPYSTFGLYALSDTHVVYEFGYGELDISDIRLDETPIASFAQTISYELRTGLSTDTNFKLYVGESSDNPLNIPIPPAGGGSSPLVMIPASRYADRLIVTLEFPNGLYQVVSTTTGGSTQTIDGVTTTTPGVTTTSQQPNHVGLTILWKARAGSTGGTDGSRSTSYEDNQTSGFRTNFYIDPATPGLYDVYVAYTNNNLPLGDIVSDIVFVNVHASLTGPSFRQIKSSSGANVYTAKLALFSRGAAQIGKLSAICKSKLASFKDGTTPSAPVITANPADIVYDMLTGISTYSPVTVDRVDTAAFRAWWLFCNTNGITFNKAYDTDTTAWSAIQEVLVIGRARMFLNGNKYSIIIDQPQSTYAQHFTNRNTSDFSFLIVYNATPNQLNVSFLDTSSPGAWQQNFRQVYDDGYTAANAQTAQDVTLVGCSDPTIAYKYGRFLMAASKLRPITYKWKTLQDAIVCNAGDLVAVTTDIIGAGLGQGRISPTGGIITDGSGNITAIKIDAAQLFVAGSTYTIRIQLKDGSSYAGAINNPGAGYNKTLTLVTPIPAATAVKPEADNLVMFGLTPSESKPMLITNITYTDDLHAELTAVDYSPAVYTADTGTIPAFDNPIQSQHPAQVFVDPPVISKVQSDIDVAIPLSGSSWQIVIALTMETPPPTVVYFEYQIRRTGAVTWSASKIIAASGSILISDVVGGVTYDIQVRSRAYTGDVSAWNTSLTGYLCVGETEPPPDPLPLIEDPVTGVLRLDAKGYRRDFAGFRIKKMQGANTNWAAAQVIGNLVTTHEFDVGPWRAGMVTFLVKTVNAANVESTNAVYIIKGFGDVVLDNVLTLSAESPTFPGSKTQMSVVGSNLQATVIPSLFWGSDPDALYWVKNPGDLFWVLNYPLCSYKWTYTTPSSVTKPSRLVMQTTIVSDNYEIWYQPPTTTLFWNAAANGGSSVFWNAHNPLFWTFTPSDYQLWPSVGVDVQITTYNFIIICQPSPIQTVISRLIMEVDTPTITYALSQVQIDPVTGTQLPIPAGTFQNAVVYVNLSLVSNPTYPNASTPVAQTPYGFQPLVLMYDNLMNQTGGTVDVVVGGY